MTATLNCPICDLISILSPKQFDGVELDCERCGSLSITNSALATWKAKKPKKRQIANASGWIRENPYISINSGYIEFLSNVQAPTINDRATKILFAISKASTGLDYRFSLVSSSANFWLGLSYSSNFNELNYLFQIYLKDELDFLSFMPSVFVDGTFIFSDIFITPKGYAHLENLSNSSNLSQIGFCAMWFDKQVLPIWTDAILPAIKNAGYEPKRIDSHAHNNRIDDEIIAMLRRSKFIVADFTGQRSGVYFEAGFALGLGLQVIWTCKKSELENNHFDTRQYNFVTWEEEKLDEFKVNLQNRIEATLGRGTLS